MDAFTGYRKIFTRVVILLTLLNCVVLCYIYFFRINFISRITGTGYATAKISQSNKSGYATMDTREIKELENGTINNTQETINNTLGIIHSDRSSIFGVDYIPKRYRLPYKNSHDAVHFCVVAARPEVAEEVNILVKSILLHSRRSDVFFHFILYEGSENTVPGIFKEINCTFTNVFYEFIYVDLRKYVRLKLRYPVNVYHVSGIYAFGKIFMFDIFKHVDTCLTVDTDIVFAVDPAFLWGEKDSHLKNGSAIAAAEWKGSEFNSGLMLQNLTLLRQMKFEQFVNLEKLCKNSSSGNETTFRCVHDQNVLNRIYRENPSLFNFFPTSWNIGKCKGFYNFNFTTFENDNLFFGAVHLTCFFRKDMNAFDEFLYKYKSRENYLNLREYIYFLKTITFHNSLKTICNGTKKVWGNITQFHVGDI